MNVTEYNGWIVQILVSPFLVQKCQMLVKWSFGKIYIQKKAIMNGSFYVLEQQLWKIVHSTPPGANLKFSWSLKYYGGSWR